MRMAFGPRGYLPAEGFLCYEAGVGRVRILALDTNVPGAAGGLLCRERLAWLDGCLAEQPDRPTLILQHHPPFATGIRAVDDEEPPACALHTWSEDAGMVSHLSFMHDHGPIEVVG